MIRLFDMPSGPGALFLLSAEKALSIRSSVQIILAMSKGEVTSGKVLEDEEGGLEDVSMLLWRGVFARKEDGKLDILSLVVISVKVSRED